MSHDEFKGMMLPALQKAMLRNPEIILECVGLILGGVNLDLSVYAGDIGKSLIGEILYILLLLLLLLRVRKSNIDGKKYNYDRYLPSIVFLQRFDYVIFQRISIRKTIWLEPSP